MKRIVITIVIGLLVVSFGGCQDTQGPAEPSPSPSSPVSEEKERPDGSNRRGVLVIPYDPCRENGCPPPPSDEETEEDIRASSL